MTTLSSNVDIAPAGEPNPVIPPLASFYVKARDLAWLLIRLTAGGMLLIHGIQKLTKTITPVTASPRATKQSASL